MQARFKLGEPLSRALGARQLSVEVPAPESGEASLGDALNALLAAYPQAAGELRLGAKESDFYYMLFVNDRLMRFADRDQATLHEGDVISILLPLAGG
jgi:molybdopterin converting factor small subunit